jgi:hypothetical protein
MLVDTMRRRSADGKAWAGSRHGAVFATKTSTGASAHVLDRLLASPNVAKVIENAWTAPQAPARPTTSTTPAPAANGGTAPMGGAIMSAGSIVLHKDSVCRIEKSTDPAGLRLYGSLDVDARSILDREVENALRDGHDLYVDLSQLEFIEVGCMHTLLEVAA